MRTWAKNIFKKCPGDSNVQPESRNSELLLYLATMKIIIHIGKLQGIKCNIAYKDICQKHPLTSSWIHFFKKQTVLFLSCISLTSMLCCRLTKSVGGKGRAAGLPEQGLCPAQYPQRKLHHAVPALHRRSPKPPSDMGNGNCMRAGTSVPCHRFFSNIHNTGPSP